MSTRLKDEDVFIAYCLGSWFILDFNLNVIKNEAGNCIYDSRISKHENLLRSTDRSGFAE